MFFFLQYFLFNDLINNIIYLIILGINTTILMLSIVIYHLKVKIILKILSNKIIK
jgi:hypothetical protein